MDVRGNTLMEYAIILFVFSNKKIVFLKLIDAKILSWFIRLYFSFISRLVHLLRIRDELFNILKSHKMKLFQLSYIFMIFFSMLILSFKRRVYVLILLKLWKFQYGLISIRSPSLSCSASFSIQLFFIHSL